MTDNKRDRAYYQGRRAELEVAYNQMKSDWQDLADHFMPRSVKFLAKNVNKAPVKNKKIKDSTPLRSVRNFSSGMMSGATNPATNWFRVKIRNYDIKSDYQVKLWCYQVEDIFRDVFNFSNFYQNLPPAYKQLGVFALAVMALESDVDTIMRTKLLPLGSYRYAKDERGVVDTMCRVYMDSAKNIYNKFGEENVSNAVRQSVKNKRFEDMYEVVHFVEPNAEYNPDSVWAKNKKFISVYYETAGDNDKFLSTSGFDKFPYVVFEAELKQSIAELFFNDLFAMILSTANRSRTATEVDELKEEKMALLSPLLEQVHGGLKQVMEWVFVECLEKRIIPEPPPQIQGGQIEIEFVSMLAQAQKVQKIASMERFTTFTINLAQAVDPTLAMKLNGTRIIDDYAEFANINPEQIVPDEQVAKLKQAMQQKQEQQQAMETLRQGSEVLKNVGGADAYGTELMQRLGMG